MVFPEELRNKFKNYISGRCGLYFKDHDLKNLENAVSQRVKTCGLGSASAYYTYLTSSVKKEIEFRELLNLLTVNHTYFFRNKPQLKALKEKILPEIIKAKKKNLNDKASLRIWSAGCSTGEEPYTLAILIREVIKDLDNWDIEIYATDASTEALQRAKEGLYKENSIKHMSKEYRTKYFKEIENPEQNHHYAMQYALHKSIKQMVLFDYLNLIEDNFPWGFDIIFCRNVIIYFELKTTIKVMNKLHSCLADNGYLFVGYSESLQFISDKFKMNFWQDSIFYRKAPKASVSQVEIPKPSSSEVKTVEVKKIMGEISKAKLMAEEKAEAHAKDKKAIEPYYLAAKNYMDQGNFTKAKEELKFVLKLDSLFAPAHYLFGAIYMEEDKLEQAKKSIKQTLYLDKNFTPAYYYLAAIYSKEGRTRDAVRQYRNTVELLSKEPPDRIIAYCGGFNAATLISVCINNIERIKTEE